MRLIIITGPPYSGKGTQCTILKTWLEFEHISTGDVCRLEKENNTKIGKILSDYEEQGDLVPDPIMKTLFNQVLDQNKHKQGIILDGYPRTKQQVDDLIELAHLKNMIIDIVININVPKTELLKRAKIRAATSTRKDDKNPENHIKRINVYERDTLPAIEYMKSQFKVLTLDGLGTINDISKCIQSRLVKNN